MERRCFQVPGTNVWSSLATLTSFIAMSQRTGGPSRMNETGAVDYALERIVL
jgi:hypothetical protein